MADPDESRGNQLQMLHRYYLTLTRWNGSSAGKMDGWGRMGGSLEGGGKLHIKTRQIKVTDIDMDGWHGRARDGRWEDKC